MKIKSVSAFYDNYIWLILDEDSGECCCVDPGEAEPVLRFLQREDFRLKAILLTHHHHDHIGGTIELIQKYPNLSIYGPADNRIPNLTHVMKDGDYLNKLSCRFQILATPGHTSTHISYYEPNLGWLFCGDTLFSAGCGRVFDGTIEELHDSLQTLRNLPDETEVYCAHEYTQKNLRFAAKVEPENQTIRNYAHRLIAKENQISLPSSIAVEKQINPFFRTQEEAVQAFALNNGSKDKDSLSVFKRLRSEKDHF
ncbi:MAG: hydroxyacylglutathione hydrolase [Tatlockia sp.]|nr:hydroxyacylglutathione hydrolase [Tatlockia sp.]